MLVFFFWNSEQYSATQVVSIDTDLIVSLTEQLQMLEDEEYQSFFSKNIDLFFKEEGINRMIQRVISSLSSGQINMFVCHSLAHDIGHYAGYPDNFKNIESYITKTNLDFCGSGFMHGVEGQLANNEYPENIEDLYTFCKLVLPFNPYYNGCYHGAGHSFMENTKNPNEAIAQCDVLKIDAVTNRDDCYRGIFAEHANLSRVNNKQSTYLLEYCSSLESNLQYICGVEVNGLELASSATQEEIEIALKTCVNKEYTKLVQLGCIRSVSGIAVDHILGQNREIIPPDFVFLLSENFLETYITATYGAYIKTDPDNSLKKLDAFCTFFTDSIQNELCTKALSHAKNS